MIRREDACPACIGSGLGTCDDCGGVGELEGDIDDCSSCAGDGVVECHACDGTGGPVWVEVLDDGERGRIAPATRGTP